MGVTARMSPEVLIPSGSGEPGRTSNSAGPSPSMDFAGRGLIDGRLGYNQGPYGAYGAGLAGSYRVIRQAPAAVVANNIAPAAHVVNGTAMTLASASTGITVLSAPLTVFPNYGRPIPTGALVLDGNPGIINFGKANPAGQYAMNWYDISKTLARCITCTGATGGAGGNFLITGDDVYGYPETQLLTVGAGAVTATTLKAFKFIESIVPQFTDAHNYEFGTADVYGFPIRADSFPDTLIWWNDALITANAGFVAADTTNPATNATGDVRGTYAIQGDTSNGSKFFTVAQYPGLNRGQTNAGLWGVTPA